MSFEQILQLVNRNFVSVVKNNLNPENPALILTDFPVDYTHGRKVVSAYDLDNYVITSPFLYDNTYDELKKLNRQVRKDFDNITDLVAKADESRVENVKRFDPFVKALVECRVPENDFDIACYRGAKRTLPIPQTRKLIKESIDFGYIPLLASMSPDRAVSYFQKIHYGIGDYIASDTIFSHGVLSWINMCTGSGKAAKMKDYLSAKGYSDIFNFRGSDDKIWDGRWANGTLDWFAWADKSLERQAIDLGEMLKYKGIISVNCPPISSHISSFRRVLFGLPRAVTFSSLINPEERLAITHIATKMETEIESIRADEFMSYLFSVKKLMGPTFVEFKSGVSSLKNRLKISHDTQEQRKLMVRILQNLKRTHPEFNLSSEEIDEIKGLNNEYQQFKTLDWGFFPYHFSPPA